jgi:hypothetical protein
VGPTMFAGASCSPPASRSAWAPHKVSPNRGECRSDEEEQRRVLQQVRKTTVPLAAAMRRSGRTMCRDGLICGLRY